MSKRLNKRQARLEEEQAQLRALQSAAEEKPAAVNDAASGGEEEEQQEEEQEKAAPVNAFAAVRSRDHMQRVEEGLELTFSCGS